MARPAGVGQIESFGEAEEATDEMLKPLQCRRSDRGEDHREDGLSFRFQPQTDPK